MKLKVAAVLGGLIAVVSADSLKNRVIKHNDFSYRPSANHPNPVVLLHGLGATWYQDIYCIAKLNDGKPIMQAGNKVTIITSKLDELVTPTDTAFIREDGVENIYVEDYCPLDPVGHIGEAYDNECLECLECLEPLNSLENQVGRNFFCLACPPGK